MSDEKSELERLNEMANSAPDSPARKELQDRLAKMDPVEREIWLSMLKESDWLYAELMRVEMPAGLDGRLLRIARADGNASAKKAGWWRLKALGPIGWKQAAALLMVIGVLTYLWWPSGEPEIVRPKPLDSTLAMRISTWAVQNQSQPSLEIRSGDPETVRMALDAKNLPFKVSLLEPMTSLQLTGGGTCRFGTAPAVYTQWKAGDKLYTLYQFDGSEIGVPDEFAETEDAAGQDSQTRASYHVKIWAGGGGLCTWALVTDSSTNANVFGESYQ